MGNYGNAAVKATQLITAGKANSPPDAWRKSTVALFGKGTSSQKKSCPRDAYLGLCESGLVRGVQPASYTKSVDNRAYAVAAAQLLRRNPSLKALGNIALWRRVLKHLNASLTKAHNQQMDVVKTLFSHGLI